MRFWPTQEDLMQLLSQAGRRAVPGPKIVPLIGPGRRARCHTLKIHKCTPQKSIISLDLRGLSGQSGARPCKSERATSVAGGGERWSIATTLSVLFCSSRT
ncbi:hypothetical protein E2C01_100922 [Portunus trituberculatus]|uniref:Uncharacterized protein n=1 Tax=Portunus trituberculatus TaxID=210409 RepID=A0A5B7K869_PORTR|nr:hypothetical protein [Portunus trituberculatus]